MLIITVFNIDIFTTIMIVFIIFIIFLGRQMYILLHLLLHHHQQSFLRYGVSGGTPPSSIFSALAGMARSTYLIYKDQHFFTRSKICLQGFFLRPTKQVILLELVGCSLTPFLLRTLSFPENLTGALHAPLSILHSKCEKFKQWLAIIVLKC